MNAIVCGVSRWQPWGLMSHLLEGDQVFVLNERILLAYSYTILDDLAVKIGFEDKVKLEASAQAASIHVEV